VAAIAERAFLECLQVHQAAVLASVMPLLCNGTTKKPIQVIKFDEIHIIVKSFFLDAGQSKT
jgi:hypothetical protein